MRSPFRRNRSRQSERSASITVMLARNLALRELLALDVVLDVVVVRERVDQRRSGASGKTGSRVRFQVELATAAALPYQARAAVTRPR